MATSQSAQRLYRSPLSLLVTVLVVTASASGLGASLQSGASRWKAVQYLGGSLGPARMGAACDLVIAGDTLTLASPSTQWKSCPVAGTEFAGRTITSIGYARGARPPIGDISGWGVIGGLSSIGSRTHVIALVLRDDNGTKRSAAFAIAAREVHDLLRALSRISQTPIIASAEDIEQPPRDLPAKVSADALGWELPTVPPWRTREKLLDGKASPFEWTPDGATLLADKSLWSLPSLQLLARLPKRDPPLGTFTPDGRTLALWFRGAREITLIDVPHGTLRRRIAVPAPFDHLGVSADGTHAFTVRAGSLSSVALDGSGVAWT